MRYLPLAESDLAEMLRTVGIDRLEDLAGVLPEPLRLKRDLDLPSPLAEMDLVQKLRALSKEGKKGKMADLFSRRRRL
jgi:glycine dehydrogenase subunit 1